MKSLQSCGEEEEEDGIKSVKLNVRVNIFTKIQI